MKFRGHMTPGDFAASALKARTKKNPNHMCTKEKLWIENKKICMSFPTTPLCPDKIATSSVTFWILIGWS